MSSCVVLHSEKVQRRHVYLQHHAAQSSRECTGSVQGEWPVITVRCCAGYQQTRTATSLVAEYALCMLDVGRAVVAPKAQPLPVRYLSANFN